MKKKRKKSPTDWKTLGMYVRETLDEDRLVVHQAIDGIKQVCSGEMFEQRQRIRSLETEVKSLNEEIKKMKKEKNNTLLVPNPLIDCNFCGYEYTDPGDQLHLCSSCSDELGNQKMCKEKQGLCEHCLKAKS